MGSYEKSNGHQMNLNANRFLSLENAEEEERYNTVIIKEASAKPRQTRVDAGNKNADVQDLITSNKVDRVRTTVRYKSKESKGKEAEDMKIQENPLIGQACV